MKVRGDRGDLKNYSIIVLESSAESVKNAIQKRLDYFETQVGVELGSLIQIDDSGYKAICDITQNSIGLALEVVKKLIPSPEQLAEKQPYIITEEQVKALGVTYEELCEWWDSPFRHETVIHMKPFYEE